VWNGSFGAKASYDVRRGKRTLHYDVMGAPFALADEKEDAWGKPQASPK
jgi:hypothetical protein